MQELVLYDVECGLAHTHYDDGDLVAEQLSVLLQLCPSLSERTRGFLRAYGSVEALQMLDLLPGRHALVLAPPRGCSAVSTSPGGPS